MSLYGYTDCLTRVLRIKRRLALTGPSPNYMHRVSGGSLHSHFQVIIRGTSLYSHEGDAYVKAGIRLMHVHMHACIWSPFSRRYLLSSAYRPTMRNVCMLACSFDQYRDPKSIWDPASTVLAAANSSKVMRHTGEKITLSLQGVHLPPCGGAPYACQR